jgi:hypothetical protein
MPDFTEILKGIGGFLNGAACGLLINEWLTMDDSDAFQSVTLFVQNQSSDQIDMMDAALLSQASFGFSSSDNRRRLIKFYTFFKMAEVNRFQQWRGFPR